MIKTWLTDRFNLSVPLIAAPMGGTAHARFVGEVARSGALGMIAIGSKATPEWVEEQVLSLPSGTERWGLGTLAWIVEKKPEILEAALAAKPPLLSISYGTYTHLVETIRGAGCVVTTQVGTLAEALEAEQAGIDFIVVRGGEGGGHGRDVMATLPLLQEVLDRVELPVVAAGGIANRRGLAAVLAAGAAGGWVGTAFLGCIETAWTDEARLRVVAAADGDTIYTRSFDSGLQLAWPTEFGGRALQNAFSQEWHEREPVSQEAIVQMAEAAASQNYDIVPLWAGQAISLVDSTRTVADVVNEFALAEELLRRW